MLNLIDVGGAGGLQGKWEARLGSIAPTIFEPNTTEADKIRDKYRAHKDIRVVERGLCNVSGQRTLHLTQHWGCVSLRQPNFDILAKYPIAKQFKVVGEKTIDCYRYDELFAKGEVPKPDVIKIDVQGCEYEVLEGFGDLLDGCVGIELETHFYPIYWEQKLLHDLVALLGRFGLTLMRLSPINHFEGDMVEADAFFLLAKEKAKTPEEKATRALVAEVYGL